MFRTARGALDRPPTRRTAAFAVTPERTDAESDGGFRRLRIEFDRALDASEIVWVGWQSGALRPLAPPRVGEVLELAAPEPLMSGMP